MYNKDELVPPDFLDKIFFQSAIQKYYNSGPLSVKNLNFKPASKIGDHFGSTMFKVEIAYTEKEHAQDISLHVVVKIAPTEEGYKKNLLNYERVFANEIEMYAKVLPAMQELLSSIGDKTEIAPGCIYYSMKPFPVLILEDISVKGFKLPDDLLDYDTTKFVVGQLARFHAASMVVNEKKYPLEHIKNSYFHVNPEDFQLATHVILPNIKMYRESVETREGFELISAKLKLFEKCFLDKMHDVYRNTEKKKIKTLCHADFHIKNMMLRQADAGKNECRFFDYQLCVWGTPAIDLVYIFYQVGVLETREEEKRMTIQYLYFETLISTLKKLQYGSKMPTFEEFKDEISLNGAVEIMQIICFYKYRFMDWTHVRDIQEEVAKDLSYMTRRVFNNPEYLRLTKKDLERCINLNYLD